MKELKNTKTEQNLLKAFAGESQAYQRYYLFAEKANQEGYCYLATIFMDNANMEQQHAKQYFSFLEGRSVEITANYPAGKVGTTNENLQASIKGETEENQILYPEYAKIAEEEGFPEIARKFRQISQIEGFHAQRFKQCLQYLENEQNKRLKKDTVWICMKCGNVVVGPERPGFCQVCLNKNCFRPNIDDWYGF